ncbi:MAG: autotransporter-associated beta strand repeat-containing protein, partial [Planctomycetota bacterium]|nr:autotransporter-associated beta strand repeat-containing protein [Planctomycetota bacterium]
TRIKDSTAGAIRLDTNGQTVSFAGAIDSSNTAGLTKLSAGTLTLSGANTYTGTTTVNAGTLTLSGSGTLGATSGALTANGSTAIVDLNGTSQTVGAVTLQGGAQINNGTLTGASFAVESGSASAILAGTGATLTKTTADTVTLSGANTYTGVTGINAGILQANNATALGNGGNITFGGGTLQFTADSAGQDWATRIKDSTAGAIRLDTNGQTVSFAGAIDSSNTAGLTKLSAGTLTLSGVATAEPLTLNGTGVSSGGALKNSSATAATYSGPITLGGASSIVAGSGNIILSDTGTITGDTFGLTLDGAATGSSIAGNIGTTTGTLTKNGTGTWTVTGTNTYTGTTTVNAGTLTINPTSGTNSATGSITVQNNGSTLNMYGTTVTSGGGVTLNNSSVVNLYGTETITGDRLLMNGNNAGTAAFNVYGTLNANRGITLANANTSANPTLTIKSGGVLNVNGSYTYAMANGSNSVRSNGTTTMDPGSTMTLDNNDNGSGFALTQGNNTAGATGGNGTFNLNGGLLTTGRIIRVLGRSNGIFNFNGGTLKTTISSTSFLWLTNSNGYKGSGSRANVRNGGAFIDSNGYTITIPEPLQHSSIGGDAAIDGGLTLNDTAFTKGTLTLSGANTFNGDTNITAGTLVIGNTSALQSSTLNYQSTGGAIQFGSSTISITTATLGGLKGDKNLDLTNASSTPASVALTVGNNNQTTTYSGILGDGLAAGGSLIKTGSGTLTLSGANTYTGGSSVSAGILQFATAAAAPSSGTFAATSTGTLAIRAGGAGEFTDGTSGAGTIGGFFSAATFAAGTTFGIDTTNAGGSLTYSGDFTGNPGITKLGAGILTLSGSHSYTGATNIAAGTLQVNGSLSSPGGLVTVPASGTLGVGAGGNIARNVTVSGGNLNLAGTLAAGTTLTLSSGAITTSAGTPTVAIADFIYSAGTVNASTPLAVTNQAKLSNNITMTLGGGGTSFGLSGANVVSPTSDSHRTLTASGGTITITATAYPTSGLLGKWTFDSQTAADSSGNGYNGTEVNTPTYSTDTHGGTGYSLQLNGSNQLVYVDTGGTQTVFDGGTAMTISAWVKGWPASWAPFVSKYGEGSNGWQDRRFSGNATLAWTTRGPNNGDMESAATNVNNGNWHMVTMTYDAAGGSNNKKIYVDGVLNAQATSTGNINSSPAMLAFGARASGNAYSTTAWGAFFTGNLDDIYFYNRAITAVEVERAYTASGISNVDLSTTDLAVTATSGVSLPAGVTQLGTMLLSGTSTPQLTLSGASATGASFDTISATGTSSIAAGSPIVPISLRSTSGNVTVAGGKTLTVYTNIVDGTTATALSTLGGGTLELAGANTYTGDTTINEGTVAISGSGTLGNGASLTMGSGALDLGGTSQTVGAVSIGAAANSGETIKNGSLTGTSYAASNPIGNAMVSANLLGSAGLSKLNDGTLTLSGINVYSGATTISGGRLYLNGSNT